MSKLVDLTQTFSPENMPVYPGDDPAKLVCEASFPHDPYVCHRIESGIHVGTHMDAPLHMVEGGKKLTEFPLEKFTGRGHLIDARNCPSIDADLLADHDINAGDIVLVFTGFGNKFKDPDYFDTDPDFTESFSKKLVERGVDIVGMDMAGPDHAPFPMHHILLGNDVLIIENLTNLESLLNAKNFRIHAYPVKLDVEGAPVRVVAEIES